MKGHTQRALFPFHGPSESLWKSLAVKSLRLGWPEGLRTAERALNKSTMKSLLLCGIFEDVFPAESEMDDTIAEVRALDYEALCARETHHGRGHTDRFCDLEARAVAAAHDDAERQRMRDWARETKIWLPPRSFNCVWTWLEIQPRDSGIRRALDTTPFAGTPKAIANGHTIEGKMAGAKVTLLSGHYSQHRVLGLRVMSEGWAAIRAEVHAEGLV